jgi:hypothetical protein
LAFGITHVFLEVHMDALRRRLMLPSVVVGAWVLVGIGADGAGGGKTTPIKVTSKDLAAAYVKNKNTAEAKYGDKYGPKEVIVEGVVVRFEKNNFGKIARLEGSGKVTVSCLLKKEDEDSVKQGEKVTIRGKCRGLFEDGKDQLIDINGGVVVKAK